MLTDFESLPSSPLVGLCSVGVLVLFLLARLILVETFRIVLLECLNNLLQEQWLLSLVGTLLPVERRFPY
jgi:hypothetical protein